jgi:hypothetical protein
VSSVGGGNVSFEKDGFAAFVVRIADASDYEIKPDFDFAGYIPFAESFLQF